MPRHKNQVNFYPYTKNQVISTPTQNQVISNPCTEIKSKSIPHINHVNFDSYIKTKYCSAQT